MALHLPPLRELRFLCPPARAAEDPWRDAARGGAGRDLRGTRGDPRLAELHWAPPAVGPAGRAAADQPWAPPVKFHEASRSRGTSAMPAPTGSGTSWRSRPTPSTAPGASASA